MLYWNRYKFEVRSFNHSGANELLAVNVQKNYGVSSPFAQANGEEKFGVKRWGCSELPTAISVADRVDGYRYTDAIQQSTRACGPLHPDYTVRHYTITSRWRRRHNRLPAAVTQPGRRYSPENEHRDTKSNLSIRVTGHFIAVLSSGIVTAATVVQAAN